MPAVCRVPAGLSDSAADDGHVTSKSAVPGYCDVIDDNMASSDCLHHPLYHHPYHHEYSHRHQHWTVAPPPPSYSSTNWDRPLQPSAPQPDSAPYADTAPTQTPPLHRPRLLHRLHPLRRLRPLLPRRRRRDVTRSLRRRFVVDNR